MKKDELVALVSEKADIIKRSAGEAVRTKAVRTKIEGIASALKKGDSISFQRFGSFKVVERSAREGRNPSTGKKMHIPDCRAVKFTPGADLKERFNK